MDASIHLAPNGTILVSDGTSAGALAYPEATGLLVGYIPQVVEKPNPIWAGLYLNQPLFAPYLHDSASCARQPSIIPQDTVQCGDSVTFTVPWHYAEGFSHRWELGGASPSSSGDSSVTVHYARPGIYSVKLSYWSDRNEERSVTSYITVLPGAPFADAGRDTALCRGESLELVGKGGDIRRWIAPDDLPCTACDTLRFPVLEEGDYILEAIDLSGCIDYDTVHVSILPDPVVDPGRDKLICTGDTVRIAAHSGTADPSLRYRWTPSTGLDCDTCFAPNASPASPTTYYVTATNEYGCSASDSIAVLHRPGPQISISVDTILCAGDSVQLSVSGGDSYRWSPDPTLSCLDCADPVARPVTTTTYVVEVTDRNGCRTIGKVTVTIESGGGLSVGGDTVLCSGGTALLTASGASRYRWLPSDGLDCDTCAETAARPERTTTYVVVGEGEGGSCARIDSVTVVVRSLPIDAAGGDTTVCAGTPVQLGDPAPVIDPAFSLQWMPGEFLDDPTLARPTAIVTEPTTFTLRIRDRETGCEVLDSVRVLPIPVPPANAGPDVTICPGERATLGGEIVGFDPDSFTFTWSPTEGLSDPHTMHPVASPLQTTTYVVAVEYRGTGCISYDTVEVVVGEGAPIRTWIGRDYRGMSGEPFVIELQSEPVSPSAGVSELLLELEWDGRVLLIDPGSIADLVRERMLEGWDVEILDSTREYLRVRFRAPAGTSLEGEGALLGLRATLYLGDVQGSKLQYRLSSPQRCPSFLGEPGRVELDTICGLDLRLIEMSAARYAAPRAVPNPGGERLNIEFGIGLDGPVLLEVFDASGRPVGTLIDGPLAAGSYRVTWDAGSVGTGVYWLRITSNEWSRVTQVGVGVGVGG